MLRDGVEAYLWQGGIYQQMRSVSVPQQSRKRKQTVTKMSGLQARVYIHMTARVITGASQCTLAVNVNTSDEQWRTNAMSVKSLRRFLSTLVDYL